MKQTYNFACFDAFEPTYEAQITSNQFNYKQKIYIGTTETDFKHRFSNHTKSLTLNTMRTTQNYLEPERFVPKFPAFLFTFKERLILREH